MDGHVEGHMQPIVAFLKLDEDCFSSDSEERLALKMPSIDNKSLLADGTAPASHTLAECPSGRVLATVAIP